MKKVILLICCIVFCAGAGAAEVGGVKLAESVHVGTQNLVLNGAGVRSKFFFDLYVAALYLGQKKSSGEAVLADAGEKRVVLYLLRDISAETLSQSFNKAIAKNHNSAELAALEPQLKQFLAIFSTIHEVKKGEVITLDYLPEKGTEVDVNDVTMGTIPGAAFNTALLKVWLGSKPAQDDLKQKLLGVK